MTVVVEVEVEVDVVSPPRVVILISISGCVCPHYEFAFFGR